MTGQEFKRKFLKYCTHVKIDSKEEGTVALKLNGCQRYLVEEIADALDDNIHHFVILKSRQLGISTIMLALVNFWMTMHPGLQGAVITDSDENKQYFRSILNLIHDTIPKGLKVRRLRDNGSFRLLANQSRIMYLTAGVRRKSDKKTSLGRAKGLNFLHATESSSWVDEDGLKSLMSSLAETFPDRLYVFESTAQGFDLFYDMWNTAKESTTQKAIFIGWWRNERYRIERNDKRFSVYWDGVLTQEEQVWVKNIKELYDYDVAIEQITWYRWKYQEQMKDPTKGVNMMSQEFPHTENDAFVLTGHKFFSTTRLTEDFKRAVEIHPRYFKYTFGFNFYDTQVKETNEWNADVAIWQEPSDQGVYVIGADCAFAGNKDSDAHAAHVLRCYADKAVQVAEFRDPFMTTTQYAWVLAHLAGAYSGRFHQCWLNLETNGPGTSVLEELNKVQQMAGAIPDMLLKDEKNIFSNVVPNIAYFIGLNPRGVNTKNYTIGWNTSNQTRSWIFNTFRSVWAQKLVEVNSKWLLREMRYVSQDGKDIVVEGKAKSDRVVAAALAAHHWYMHLVPDLKQKNMIYLVEEKRELLARENVGISNAVQTCVTKHFQRRGIDT